MPWSPKLCPSGDGWDSLASIKTGPVWAQFAHQGGLGTMAVLSTQGLWGFRVGGEHPGALGVSSSSPSSLFGAFPELLCAGHMGWGFPLNHSLALWSVKAGQEQLPAQSLCSPHWLCPLLNISCLLSVAKH